uniref:Frizzled C SciFzdC n=2 Tax=Sycon ciliatum TaxID=27933 RepID=A0A077SP38_9METZ|nr:Frizzled C SciFzdC [Sycon ciliatum]|eukprot:scpid41534/ scgid31220/ Frizzled-9; FzE6
MTASGTQFISHTSMMSAKIAAGGTTSRSRQSSGYLSVRTELSLALITLAVVLLSSTVQCQYTPGKDLSHRACRTFDDVPLCYERIGYNRTRWPNTLEENLPLVVNKRLDDMKPLVQTHCHPWLFAFLCFIHVPHCTPDMDPFRQLPISHVVGPCRQLCELVRDACLPYIRAFQRNMTWPDHLYDCSKLISHPGQCFMPHSHSNETVIPTGWDIGPHIQVEFSDIPPTALPTTTFTATCPGGSAVDKSWYRFGGQRYCGQSCTRDTMYTERDRDVIMPAVFLAIAILSVLALLISLVSFVADLKNFLSPEWGVLLINVCGMVAGITQLIAVTTKLIGHNQSCDSTSDAVYQGMGGESRLPPVACLLTFFLTYFTGVLALFTWFKLSVFWLVTVMATRKTIRKIDTYLTIPATAIVWLVPTALTVAVFLLQKIDGGLLTGACSVGSYNINALLNFVICPVSAVSIAVLFCLFVGWRVLLLQRHYAALASPRSNATATTESSTAPILGSAAQAAGLGDEQYRLRFERIGKFCVLLLVPAVGYLTTLLYEYVEQDEWQLTAVACAEDGDSPGCTGGRHPLLSVFGIRYFMALLIALICLWYKNLFCSWLPCVKKACAVSQSQTPSCIPVSSGNSTPPVCQQTVAVSTPPAAAAQQTVVVSASVTDGTSTNSIRAELCYTTQSISSSRRGRDISSTDV